MHGLNPFVERPEELETKSWIALAVSALVHLSLMLWLVLRPVGADDSPSNAHEAGQSAQPIALPRPAEPKTPQPKAQPTPEQSAQPAPPPAPPAPPPPPTKETPLGPDSKNPDAPIPKEAGPVKPMTEPEPKPTKSQVDPGPPAEKPAQATPPAPAEAPPAEAAKRIPRAGDLAANSRLQGPPTSPWGPTSRTPLEQARGEGATTAAAAPAIKEGSMGRVGQSGTDSRDWRPSFEEAAGRCVSIPDLGTNADGTPVLATVIGRVLQTDGRSPLAGAHLQIIGTPFSTFSDGNGEYRLEFDPKLLEQCRVQYVRVGADGYSGAMLTLSIGERVRSDDVVLRRR